MTKDITPEWNECPECGAKRTKTYLFVDKERKEVIRWMIHEDDCKYEPTTADAR